MTSPQKSLNVAVVGSGAVTERLHLPALARRADCRVATLVDRNPDRAKRLAASVEGAVVAADYRDLATLGVDAAIVTLPNHLHAPVSVELLKAGIHVLVEKPMALSAAECDEMLEAARAGSAVLAVGLTRRFIHASRFVKWALECAILGRISSFEVREGRVFSWPAMSDFFFRREMAGGGVLMDTGVHTLDQLLWWLGEVESLEYSDDSLGGVEADCDLRLRFRSGAEGVVELSRTRNLRNTAILRGERGELEVVLEENTVSLRLSEGPVWIAGQGVPTGQPAAVSQGQVDIIAAEHEDWLRAIRTGGPVAVPGSEGRRSVALIEACYAQRRPLRLPWITPVSMAPAGGAA